MSLLTRQSTIFIEFMDLVVNSDLYVVKRLVELMSNEIIKLDYLTPLLNEFKDEPDNYIIERLNSKFNLNPLLDYLDMSKLVDGINYMDEMNNLYNTVLCEDISSMHKLKSTNLLDSLVNILSNKDIKSIYVYYPKYSQSIHFFIRELFNDSKKVSVVDGDIESAICNLDVDSYFIRDIVNIHSLMNKPNRKQTIDFVVPEFKCNYINNGITEDLDLPIPAQDIYNKHNINVRAIKLPI